MKSGTTNDPQAPAIESEAAVLAAAVAGPPRASSVAVLLASSAELAIADVSAREAMRWGLDLVCAHLGWPLGRVITLDHATCELVDAGIWHDEAPERHGPFVEAFDRARTSLDVGLPGAVAREGRAIATDAMDARINPAGRELGIACELTFAVALPILSDRGVEGVIEVMGPDHVAIDGELLGLFTQVGLQVGRVIERDRARRLLREAERLAEIGPWSWDVDRDELRCSPELFAMHGSSPPIGPDGEERYDPIRRRDFLRILSEPERSAVETFGGRMLTTGRSDELEYHVKRGRSTRWLRLHATVVERRDGRVVRVAGYVQDVTAHRRVEQRRHRAQLALAREQRALERIALGEPLERTLGGLCRNFERQYPEVMCSVMVLDRGAGVLTHAAAPSLPEGLVRTLDRLPAADGSGACGTAAARGSLVIIEDVATDPLTATFSELAAQYGIAALWSLPLSNTNGEVTGTLALYRRERGRPSRAEIRDARAAGNLASLAIERSRAAAALQSAANYDGLTRLPNRSRFLELVASELTAGRQVAVMLVEVDRFRHINESLGNLAGERILLEVAKRVRRAVGDDGTVGRFAGTEFAIVLRDPSEERIADVPDRVLRALERPISLDGGEFFLTASVGIALGDGHTDSDPLALVRDADAAMSAARSRGSGRRQIYDHRMRALMIERLNLESELRRGIGRGELEVHYQPVLDLRERRWCQVEALVRWRHPKRGLLAPDDFIPLAEETGLIVPLGMNVLEQVTAQAARWAVSLPGIGIAANASPLQLVDPGIAGAVIEMLSATDVSPQSLILEVTESALMEEVETTKATLAQLVAHGVRIVIDDFGTGYSSLARLGELPIAGLKVDRRFTEGLGADPDKRRVLRAIADLARAYRLSVVAEGIEDAGSLADVNALGCRFAQGFHLGRPALPDAVESLLARPPRLAGL